MGNENCADKGNYSPDEHGELKLLQSLKVITGTGGEIVIRIYYMKKIYFH